MISIDVTSDHNSRLTDSAILKIVHLSANGLMSKLINLKDAASSGRWDIICVTEAQLLSLIPDSFVAIPNYIFFQHHHGTTGPTANHSVCAVCLCA